LFPLKKIPPSSGFVYRSDGQGRQAHVVSQKYQSMLRDGIFEPDMTQVFGVVFVTVVPVQCNGLNASDDACPADFGREQATSVHFSFGAATKKMAA
jgi:hypothetical protein